MFVLLLGGWERDLGAVSIRKTVLPGMAIPMLKINVLTAVLSLTWKSPYVDKTVFILRRGPVLTHQSCFSHWCQLKSGMSNLTVPTELQRDCYNMDQYIIACRKQTTKAWITHLTLKNIPWLALMSEQCSVYQGPLLLTWFNFNPSMDK